MVISAREKALELLARREHSSAELKNKLLRRNFDANEIDEVLDYLMASNLLSDQRFSETYLHRRMLAGYGPKQIAQELRQRGITQLPQLVLEENDEAWVQILKQLCQKKFKNSPMDTKDYARQMRFLVYRGFNIDQIKKLLQIKHFDEI